MGAFSQDMLPASLPHSYLPGYCAGLHPNSVALCWCWARVMRSWAAEDRGRAAGGAGAQYGVSHPPPSLPDSHTLIIEPRVRV